MRLIDADKLREVMERYDDYAVDIVDDAPTVDAVEVVRCENCEFYDEDDRWCRRLGLVGAFNADGFCSHGERRE